MPYSEMVAGDPDAPCDCEECRLGAIIVVLREVLECGETMTIFGAERVRRSAERLAALYDYGDEEGDGAVKGCKGE